MIIVCTGGYSVIHTFNNKKVTAQKFRAVENGMPLKIIVAEVDLTPA